MSGTATTLDPKARELLRQPNFCAVSTIGDDGTPNSAVVWCDVDDEDRVILNSAEGRKWPAAIRRDPRVTLLVVNHENPYEYAEIKGRMVDADHEEADADIDRLAKKYLDEDTYPFRQPGEQRVTFRIKPERVRIQGS